MRVRSIFPAWGRILTGYRPFLSVEVTKECPLKCPGCYAYDSRHMNDGRELRELSDWRGAELVERVIALVQQARPLHVSLIGGEPMMRHRELGDIIARLDKMGIEIQVVTSGVVPIPQDWSRFSNLHIAVSVDGLEEEHNARRAPATYERILRNIEGHKVIIHCTIVSQFLRTPDYLKRFADYWSKQPTARRIWFSLFTPQKGDTLPERLTPEQRLEAIARINEMQAAYPKIHAPAMLLDGLRHPPASPSECIFAQVTECYSPDLSTTVSPCQIGGRPDCAECGCIAAAAFSCIGDYKLGGLVRLSGIYSVSRRIGLRMRKSNGRSGNYEFKMTSKKTGCSDAPDYAPTKAPQ